MLIDFNQPLLALDGKEIKTERGGEVTPCTLGHICVDALMAQSKEADSLSGEDKVRRYDLALVIYAAQKPLDCRVEDLSLLKQLIGALYSPLVVGQAWRMIDSKPVPSN